MSAFGTPKKAPRAMKKLTDEMLQGYHDSEIRLPGGRPLSLYRGIKAVKKNKDGEDICV